MQKLAAMTTIEGRARNLPSFQTVYYTKISIVLLIFYVRFISQQHNSKITNWIIRSILYRVSKVTKRYLNDAISTLKC